jgi:hypothetical protein
MGGVGEGVIFSYPFVSRRLMWVWVGFEQASLRIMFVIIYLRFFLILTTNILDYHEPLQYD